MSDEKAYSFHSHLMGEYNAENIAAAVAVGIQFQVPGDDISRAIESYHPNNNRSQLIKYSGSTILLDAYNANPVSMSNALDVAENWDAQKKIVILGDMKELGDHSEDSHRNLIHRADSIPGARVFFVGSIMKNLDERAYVDVDEFCDMLSANKNILEDAFILIKGSRSVRLEKILDVLSIDL